MDSDSTREYFEFAHRLADEVRPLVLGYFRREFVVEQKSNLTPVTQADIAVEARLRELIHERYPSHGIVGEEFGNSVGNSDYVWVLDPIDGTRAFICGLPLFGTLISLTKAEQPLLGILDQAHLSERWSGGTNVPCQLNDLPARTSGCQDLARARTSASSPHYFAGADEAPLRRLADACSLIRYGASCYGYGLLASGFVDVLIDADLHEHDYLAQVSIIESAGGVITDWEGNRLKLNGGATRVVASCSEQLHEQVLAQLNS